MLQTLSDVVESGLAFFDPGALPSFEVAVLVDVLAGWDLVELFEFEAFHGGSDEGFVGGVFLGFDVVVSKRSCVVQGASDVVFVFLHLLEFFFVLLYFLGDVALIVGIVDDRSDIMRSKELIVK